MPLDSFQLKRNVSAASNPAMYLTDTTSFDQLNAISAVQGLTLVSSNKFDNIGVVGINNCFTSLYQNYRVLLNLTNVDIDADFTLRLRSGGVDAVNNLYDNVFPGIDSSAAAQNAVGTSTAFLVGESDATSSLVPPRKNVRYRLCLDFLTPFEQENTVIVGQYHFINKAATLAISRNGSGSYQYNTSFDGFSFISSSTYSITAISAASGIVTYSIANTAGLSAGQTITITGATIPGYNGTFRIASVTANTNITIINPTTGATSTATGVINPNVSGVVRVYGYKG